MSIAIGVTTSVVFPHLDGIVKKTNTHTREKSLISAIDVVESYANA